MSMDTQTPVTVIGAGLAGCECAWQLAEAGIPVTLYEMKPTKKTPAHHSNALAELVCSNSMKALGLESAVGLLKEELRLGGSLLIQCALDTQVPAGGALAVDRDDFSAKVEQSIKNHENITLISEELTEIPKEGQVVIATGPLTSDDLAKSIQALFPEQESLHFFDAAAPIVSFESIDMNKAFYASRYDKGTPDYINCPMEEEEYTRFWQALCTAEQADVHGFEDKRVFEGCMPVEVAARRGEKTLCFGIMKPVGLKNPHSGREAHAVLQLRKENNEGTMYNLVGCQTHLKFGEQKRVFGMIPGLENAEFLRYGVMHRNTFIQSPKLLNRYFQVVAEPRLMFAGQITGVEGYVPSIASGWLVGQELSRRILGKAPLDLPRESATGALSHRVCDGSVSNFQPMEMNFGLLPPLGYRIKGKKNKNAAIARRGLKAFCLAVGIEWQEPSEGSDEQ